MKRALQTISAVVVFAVVIIWAGKGANTGWTKNKAQIKTVDPVTEIEQVEWKNAFVPGLDFLGVGLFSSAALAVIARFIRTNKEPITNKQNHA